LQIMGKTLDDIHFDMYRRGVKRCGSHKAYMKTLPKKVRKRMQEANKKTHCERHYGMKTYHLASVLGAVSIAVAAILTEC
jgi:hypothetical protein